MVETVDKNEAEETQEEEEEVELPPEPLAVDLPQAQFQQGKPGKPGAKPSGSKKERLPVIHESDWVRLAYESDEIPDHLKGHYAAVLSAPYTWETDPQTGRPTEMQDEDVQLTVETRDEYNAVLAITREDIDELHQNGKPGRP